MNRQVGIVAPTARRKTSDAHRRLVRRRGHREQEIRGPSPSGGFFMRGRVEWRVWTHSSPESIGGSRCAFWL